MFREISRDKVEVRDEMDSQKALVRLLFHDDDLEHSNLNKRTLQPRTHTNTSKTCYAIDSFLN